MALPEGTVPPEYVEDSDEDIEAIGEIFARVGGLYMGDGKFAVDSEEEDDLDEADLQEWYEGYPFLPAGAHRPDLPPGYDPGQFDLMDDYDGILVTSMYD